MRILSSCNRLYMCRFRADANLTVTVEQHSKRSCAVRCDDFLRFASDVKWMALIDWRARVTRRCVNTVTTRLVSSENHYAAKYLCARFINALQLVRAMFFLWCYRLQCRMAWAVLASHRNGDMVTMTLIVILFPYSNNCRGNMGEKS